MTIDRFIKRKEEMILTEELWTTCGFQHFYSSGWKLDFEDLILYFEDENFPNTLEQLLLQMRDHYILKGEKLGKYQTKKHLREFLEIT